MNLKTVTLAALVAALLLILTGCKPIDYTDSIVCPHFAADPVYAYKYDASREYVVVFPDHHYDRVSDVSCVVSPSKTPLYSKPQK